jgi:cell division protein ZapA
MTATTQTVSIFGREYRVACAPEERDALLACARYVDEKMSGIRAGGRTLGADRVAVLAALQIAQELFAARNGEGVSAAELKRRVRELHSLADDALAPQEKFFT